LAVLLELGESKKAEKNHKTAVVNAGFPRSEARMRIRKAGASTEAEEIYHFAPHLVVPVILV